LALEIFFFYALLCQRNEGRVRALGSVFLERLGLMFEAVLQLSASDGTVHPSETMTAVVFMFFSTATTMTWRIYPVWARFFSTFLP